MSRIEIFAINEKGEVLPYADVWNAHAGTLTVWDQLQHKYRGVLDIPWDAAPYQMPKDYEKLWALVGTGKLTWVDELLLASTFDRVIIPKGLVHSVAQAWRKFFEAHIEGTKVVPSTLGVAEVLEKAAADPSVCGIAFNHTSVCPAFWEVEEEEDSRPYNINKDKEGVNGGHWFIESCLSKEYKTHRDYKIEYYW